MTATLDRAEPTPAPRRHWRAPRRPVTIAVVGIALVTAALWGLRWWGPMNPEIAIGWIHAETDATPTITLEIQNRSRSSVTVESVDLVRLDTRGVVTTEISPVDIAPQGSTTVVATMPPCPEPDEPRFASSSLRAAVSVRNQAGWTVVTDGDLGYLDPCPGPTFTYTPPTVVLPPAGVQPVDPAVARRGVEQAYWTTYDGSRPAEERLAAIDDPRGVAEANTGAPPPPEGLDLTLVRSDVREIVFDTPEHAWVDYAIAVGLQVGPPQVGEAVLVDGTWKVTRSTVCRDLLLLNATCPP